MSDEFDPDYALWHPTDLDNTVSQASQRLRKATPRLVSRLYRQAPQPLRTQMLQYLLSPLNTLSLMGVSAGAFAYFLDHKPKTDSEQDLDHASHFLPSQIAELTDFVEQVNPNTVAHMATMLASHAAALASIGATTAMLMRRSATPEIEAAPKPAPRKRARARAAV